MRVRKAPTAGPLNKHLEREVDAYKPSLALKDSVPDATRNVNDLFEEMKQTDPSRLMTMRPQWALKGMAALKHVLRLPMMAASVALSKGRVHRTLGWLGRNSTRAGRARDAVSVPPLRAENSPRFLSSEFQGMCLVSPAGFDGLWNVEIRGSVGGSRL